MSLRERTWRRFLRGPDPALLEELYVPALSAAFRYDRSCAYFSSSVLAAAARGFGPLIARLVALGGNAPRPAVRLVVNEQLSRADVDALLDGGSTAALEEMLLERLRDPVDALERDRLGMLAYLVREGLLAVRVGVLRRGGGIVHAKFGIATDERGDAVVFMGSGNETAQGLLGNYEEMEITPSWEDPGRCEYYRDRFEKLWLDRDADVATVTLPEAVRLAIIKYATEPGGIGEPWEAAPADERKRREAAMRWRFVVESPFFEQGGATCDATAMVDLWPHQRRVVEDTAAAWPDGRLLCDEVGMGKTIEAILILRQLLSGRGVQRALLLLPAGLLQQWQAELREKGGLVVPRLEGTTSLVWPDGAQRKVAGLAEALEEDLLIMSRETARLEQNAQVLIEARPWDLVLLDEAHAARRARQEEREFNSATLLLQLLRRLQLDGRARGLLLLSATPMQTHPWEPWDLLSVLGEGAPWLSDFRYVRDFYNAVPVLAAGPTPLERGRDVEQVISQDDLFPPPPVPPNQLAQRLAFAPRAERARLSDWLRTGAPLGRRMHRNTRATLRAYHERGILATPPPGRAIVDCRFEYQDEAERAVYDSIAGYVTRRFEELEEEKPGKGFVMTVYRRRAASSPFALRRSLERRREGLRRVIRAMAADTFLDPHDALDTLDLDDLPDGEQLGRLSPALPTDRRVAESELRDVDRILNGLDGLGSTDTKMTVFLDALRTATDDGRPVLVFSEFADTVEYLRDTLFPRYGTSLGCYTGDGGKLWEADDWKTVGKDVITARLRAGDLRVLLCTDAASEGLNLQAAGAVINYDLPWNPSRIEQRAGRVDRIGQRAPEVRIVNLFLADSVDDNVYQVLRERCGMFEHFVGVMQPVLAAARTMLLGRDRFDRSLLEQLAEQVDSDQAASAAFDASLRVPEAGRPAGLVREEALEALLTVRPSAEMEIAGRVRRVTVSEEELVADPLVWPLCPFDPHLRRLSDELEKPGELLPLVIGVSQDGAFRAGLAYWCHPDHRELVERYERLEALLGEWDGAMVSPGDWIAAEGEAKRLARARVEVMRNQAEARQRRGLERQVEAAKLRLLRQLAWYLLCADPEAAELNQAFHAQQVRDIASAVRLKHAHDLVGYPEWESELVEEVRREVQKLSTNQRKNVLLGSPLDAAIADPRWRVRVTLVNREGAGAIRSTEERAASEGHASDTRNVKPAGRTSMMGL